MQDTLAAILAVGAVPAALTITYDEMHALWGGITLTVHGDGHVERHSRALGEPATQVYHTAVERQRLLDLLRVLVQLNAWEQHMPERPPLPDESRAVLTISVGTRASRVWERCNDLAANNRLVHIKHWLEQI